MPGSLRLLAPLLIASLPLTLAAEPIRVSGRILASAERGLAGARVELLPAYEGSAETVQRLGKPEEATPLAVARTDAEGFFALNAPESGCFRVRVRVRADGYAPEEHPLLPLVEDADLPSTLLEPAARLSGVVVDAAGRPVAGVDLSLGATGFGRERLRLEPVRRPVPDLRTPLPGERRDQRSPERVRAGVRPHPDAGARTALPPSPHRPRPGPHPLRTDRRREGATGGRHRGDPRGRGGSHQTLKVPEGDRPVAIDIPTGALSGRILSAGAPVPDAVVEVEGILGGFSQSFFAPNLRSDGDGGFEIPRLAAGSYTLNVTREGLAPSTMRVQVRPGAAAAVEIELKPVP